MPVTSDAEEDYALGVIPPIRPTAPWRVVAVEALEGYSLKVRFVDGTEGLVHMKGLIFSPQAGIFEALRDPAFFAEAHLVFGAVTWPGDIDLAPDAMHHEIGQHGEWVLDA